MNVVGLNEMNVHHAKSSDIDALRLWLRYRACPDNSGIKLAWSFVGT